MDILLATINARYAHASLSLRYLRANLLELRAQSQILEFTLEDRACDIAEKLIRVNPQIIGFAVYIWNTELLLKVIKIIKITAPKIIIVVGGPEVSYEYQEQEICKSADYTIIGNADQFFYVFCKNILEKKFPNEKFLRGDLLSKNQLASINFPYDEYSDEDLQNRNIYLEASRGCPFRCEFCLSSLDKTAYPFPLEEFINQLGKLWQRGLRKFKFVDRTFNINPTISQSILDFFLDKLPQQFFVHFEMIPDLLADELKERISRFPAGSIQLEIGIQSWNKTTQKNISRKQDDIKTINNLEFLQSQTKAHLHTDLIIGLPSEDINSFADGFNKLYHLGVSEIQVGMLKRLRGTPILRHSESEKMIFNPHPPYEILTNVNISFLQMQELSRFARFWDLIGNSGRFTKSLKYLIHRSPFANFYKLSEGIYKHCGQTHKIGFERLVELIYSIGKDMVPDPAELEKLLISDYQKSSAFGKITLGQTITKSLKNATPIRQQRHINANQRVG